MLFSSGERNGEAETGGRPPVRHHSEKPGDNYSSVLVAKRDVTD